MSKRQERERQKERVRDQARWTKAKPVGTSDILDEHDPVWAWIPGNWDDKCPACDSTDFLTGDDEEGEFDELCSNCGLTRESQQSRVDSMLVELKRSFRENLGYNIEFVEKVLANLGTTIRTDGLDFVVEGMGLTMEDIDPEIIVFAEAKRKWREQGYRDVVFSGEEVISRWDGLVQEVEELDTFLHSQAHPIMTRPAMLMQTDLALSKDREKHGEELSKLSDLLDVLAVTKTIEVGVDIDALREDLRLHLLERAQGEFENPRPHQYAYSNELLDELVRIRPRTKNALRSINGMGPWRMESSGEILRIIDEWLMRRCVHSIQSNMELLAVTPEMEVSVTPEVLDTISEHFAEWTRGRDEPPKRISTAEAKQEILDVMDPYWACPTVVYSFGDKPEQRGGPNTILPDGSIGGGCGSREYLRELEGVELSGIESILFPTRQREMILETQQRVQPNHICDRCGYVLYVPKIPEKARVSELRDGLADRGVVFSPSRLSQIITSMVKDDLIVRKKPVPYEKGVVILELTEKGLQESRKTLSH